jgi:hypothetical protein
MASYGQVIDTFSEPEKEFVYQGLIEYFENPMMTKIKDAGEYSMYGVKIHALLGIENRYLLLFKHKDTEPIGTSVNLSLLRWVTIQTRALTDEYDVSTHSYIPRRTKIDTKLFLFYHDNKQFNYHAQNLPIQVTLLPKKGGIEYSNTGSLVSALETYQTILSFV